jgi:hypothetical protein
MIMPIGLPTPEGRTTNVWKSSLAKHSDMDPPYDNPTLVTEEKLFGFLHYQSRRPTRKRRTKNSYKKQRCAITNAPRQEEDDDDDKELQLFDEAELDYYMTNIDQDWKNDFSSGTATLITTVCHH